MVDDFLNYIEKEALLKKEERILLAVSGGIDSVVMAYLFQHTSFNFGIAHCNFQLRGEDSDKDELFVKSLAKQFDVPFYNKSFDTKKYATNNGVSTQMAARELRYIWFEGLVQSEKYNCVATAHHINDSIETAIFNFSKGTGISGVRGILSRSSSTIRPLLFTSRARIEVYAKKNKIKWREDRSNKTDTYSRNHIRHNIIPELEKLNPNLNISVITTFERLRDVESILKKQAELFKKEKIHHINECTYISLKDVSEIEGFRSIIYEILKEYGFNYLQTKEILKRRKESGRHFIAKMYTLSIDRDQLIIERKNQKKLKTSYRIELEDDIVIAPIGTLKFDWKTNYPSKFIKNNNIAYVSMDQLVFPLELRHWKQGDYFQPLGMSNKKKLSDLMIDRKIPLNLKKNIMVLESDNKIIWVIGQQPDERFKITKGSKAICKIEYLPSK